MSRPKWDVLWSPFHTDRFITWDTDALLNLYEIGPRVNNVRENDQSYLQISEHSVAELLCSVTINSYAKCVDIYPQPEPDIVASGHANGKIVLSILSPPEFDYQGLVGREFCRDLPKYMRSCNVVAWNPVDTHLIMSGLDKHSKEHSVLLWDVHHCPKGSERPIIESGISETVHSAAWFKHEPRCLALGVNNKQLKVIDFRDSTKVVNVTPTKAIYNLSVNPHNNYQLLSHVDNLITIWDTRCFEKPIVTIMPQRQVTKVLWCPTRRNLIGTLQKDSVGLHLFDIQYCGAEDTEPGVLERVVLPPWHNPLSFSWHPTDENRLLAISLQGVTDYTVSERITLNWSARSCLMWNCAFKSFKYIHSEDSVYKELDDISVLTKRRAMFEYGLLPELAHNGDIAENESLKNLWQWLYLSRSLVEDGTIQSTDNKHPGVRAVLKLDGQNQVNGSKTEVLHRPWADIGSSYTTKVYRSPDRERSLLLCGLRFDRETNTAYDNAYLEKLEKEGAYAKAAAFAVFNLCLKQAIDILNRGASKKQTTILNMVAMALSGFSEERTTLWRESCQKSKSQLSDPYLRATFGFLTADNDSYESVLNENGMAVEDRVAFALMFLSDNKLCEYLKKLTQKVIEDGDLTGFLVTGASMDSIHLLNKYLEITSDVQSSTLIAIRTFPPKLLQENQVQVWITSYRQLLNAWKLWFQRAKFDIAMKSSTSQERPPAQIHISCHFCGKSISASMQGLSRTRVPFGRLGSTPNKLKMTACPNCRKPLPRCAICLMHIGTVSGLQTAPSPGGTRNEECNTKLTEFNSWFSWCLTCKHGGHSEHIAQWFRQHTECPVTSCNCRCSSLDYTRNASVT